MLSFSIVIVYLFNPSSVPPAVLSTAYFATSFVFDEIVVVSATSASPSIHFSNTYPSFVGTSYPSNDFNSFASLVLRVFTLSPSAKSPTSASSVSTISGITSSYTALIIVLFISLYTVVSFIIFSSSSANANPTNV